MLSSNSKNSKVFVGVDVHTTNFNVSFLDPSTGEFKYERKIEPDNYELYKYLNRIKNRHYKDFEIIIGYEAGYLGYTIARYLKEKNFNCKIIAPHTIRRTVKEKRIKNDVIDARLIARTLFNGDYSEVYLPDEMSESYRHVLRRRDCIKQEQNRVKNQILALWTQKDLKYNGQKGNWSQEFISFLKECIKNEKYEFDKYVMIDLLDAYFYNTAALEKIDKKIFEISQEEQIKDDVEKLCLLRGIDTLTAVNIINSVGDIKRFDNAKSFVSYLGLSPGEHSSGKKEVRSGISKTGNSNLRRLFILAAKSYMRGSPTYKSKDLIEKQSKVDPAVAEYSDRCRLRLYKKYRHLTQDLLKNSNKAICAVARELAGFVWGMLSGNISL